MSPLLPAPRALAAFVAVSVALVLQASLFSHLAVQGVVPNLVLLVVVAAGLVHGSELGLVLGFGAGLLLDLAPPADHVAGRWALALLVVGYVVGRLAHDHQPAQTGSGRRPPYPLMLAAGAGGAFVGTSVFALSGTLLRDPAVGIGDMLEVVLTAVAYDVLVALVVLPVTVWILTREPGPGPARVTPRLPRRTPV